MDGVASTVSASAWNLSECDRVWEAQQGGGRHLWYCL